MKALGQAMKALGQAMKALGQTMKSLVPLLEEVRDVLPIPLQPGGLQPDRLHGLGEKRNISWTGQDNFHVHHPFTLFSIQS